MENKPKQDVAELQEQDIINIKENGFSNNMPDEENKELPRWYVMAGFIPESELPF